MDGIATQAVFFTAGLVVAAVLASALIGQVGLLAGGLEAHGQVAAAELRSAIRVVSDPANVPTSPVKLLVKNVGARSLLPGLFDVLVDGQARPAADIAEDVLDDADDTNLGPAEVVQLTISNLSLATGDHDAKVIADTGASDTFRFHVG